MESLIDSLGQFLYTAENMIVSAFSGIGFFDVVDILLLTYIFYLAIVFCSESRASTLIKGIFLLVAVYFFSSWFGMVGINWLLEKIINYALIFLAIIFQPELRRALEKLGHSNLIGIGRTGGIDQETVNSINTVCKSVGTMSENKVGALIVFENRTPLGDIINTGTVLDASPSVSLICNVFYPKSPLHDGAMVIRDGRIKSAACILPLTAKLDISQELGTRHRAALGMSENSDAVTVVVSEETGGISITYNGNIERNLNSQELQQRLFKLLTVDETQKTSFFNNFINSFRKNKEENKNG